MNIGFRSPRRPAPSSTGAGYFWSRLAGRIGAVRTPEQKDEAAVERGYRLQAFLESEVWHEDILPLLHEVYDDVLRRVIGKDMDSDALLALEGFAQGIDKSIALSEGAARRMAERHMKRSVAVEATQEAQESARRGT